MKEKHAYLFFNCDEEKSKESKNIFYNKTVYQDTKKARKALWEKIEEECKAGRVHIADEALDGARTAVLEGNPVDASSSMEFGTILSLDII